MQYEAACGVAGTVERHMSEIIDARRGGGCYADAFDRATPHIISITARTPPYACYCCAVRQRDIAPIAAADAVISPTRLPLQDIAMLIASFLMPPAFCQHVAGFDNNRTETSMIQRTEWLPSRAPLCHDAILLLSRYELSDAATSAPCICRYAISSYALMRLRVAVVDALLKMR